VIPNVCKPFYCDSMIFNVVGVDLAPRKFFYAGRSRNSKFEMSFWLVLSIICQGGYRRCDTNPDSPNVDLVGSKFKAGHSWRYRRCSNFQFIPSDVDYPQFKGNSRHSRVMQYSPTERTQYSLLYARSIINLLRPLSTKSSNKGQFFTVICVGSVSSQS
jgi:hypothetical protein